MWDHTEDVTLFTQYTLSLVLRRSTNLTKNHTHHRITIPRLHSESRESRKKNSPSCRCLLSCLPPHPHTHARPPLHHCHLLLHPSPSLARPFHIMSLASVSVVLITSLPCSPAPSTLCLQPPPLWFYESRLLAQWSRILLINGSNLGILTLIFLFLVG
jgi:hypothetical protein